jgi:glycosyltransferase involved in cell wall biosynthesis
MTGSRLRNIRVAVVHYWFRELRRGGEKVVEALLELFPQADIFTNIFDKRVFSHLSDNHTVKETFIGRLPMAKQAAGCYVPLMPFALEQLDFAGYDLVISSESGPAKSVIVPDHCAHLCYCHSPMRYIWNKHAEQARGTSFFLRMPMRVSAHYLRLVDYAAAARVDQFIANSTAVAHRIEKYYRRSSRVVFPPVDVSAFAPAEQNDDFYLYCGQLTGYKRPDLVVECFNRLGLPLWIIGDGEMLGALKRRAMPNIRFLGRVSDAVVRDSLGRCKALVFPGEEDFGIVPVEAMASGRPVIAFGRGGALDTIVDGVTGLFFQEESADGLAAAVQIFEQMRQSFDPQAIVRHAAKFDKQHFLDRMTEIVEEALHTT